MRDDRIRLLQRVGVILIVFVILVPICVMGAFYHFVSDGSFLIGIPQDCESVQREITGRVQNRNGQPISASVHIQAGYKPFPGEKVDVRLDTDQDGKFSLKNVSVYACDNVDIQIATKDGPVKELSFIAAIDSEAYGEANFSTQVAQGHTPVLPNPIIIELP